MRPIRGIKLTTGRLLAPEGKNEWSYNTISSLFHHGVVKENFTHIYFRQLLPIYGFT